MKRKSSLLLSLVGRESIDIMYSLSEINKIPLFVFLTLKRLFAHCRFSNARGRCFNLPPDFINVLSFAAIADISEEADT